MDEFDDKIKTEIEETKLVSPVEKEDTSLSVENHFENINDHTILSWETILHKNRSSNIKYVKDDSELLNEDLDMYNQRVIKNDCDRTRVKDKPLLQSFREYLECMLTYYCKKNNIKYKQGMNEIVGPFILLKSQLSLSLSKIFNLFSSFVEKFLTNYYYEDEFFSLQSSMGLLNLLLKYHDPELINIFEFSLITPEIKTKLGVLYYFWDLLIKENDELFIHFFIVAFLKIHRDDIVSTDHSQIPTLLSQMNLKSKELVLNVYNLACAIRSKTPYSIRILARNLEIFKPHSTRLKELFNLYEPENILLFPILPSEIFSIAYNNIILCPDLECKNFKNLYDGENTIYCQDGESYSDKFYCHFCLNKYNVLTNKEEKEKEALSPQISYILLDLRIAEDKNNDHHYDVKPGFLPMTVILDQDELMDEKFADKLSDRFLNEKGKYHFIFITSETDYFNEFEERFYDENVTEREKRKMMYCLQTKVSKEINTKLVNKCMKKEKKKRFPIKIKEYDNLKKLIDIFISKNYPYISYVYGGFLEIHEQSIKYNIPLLNHDDSCYICKKIRKKNQKKGFFAKLFKKKENQTKIKSPENVLSRKASDVKEEGKNNQLQIERKISDVKKESVEKDCQILNPNNVVFPSLLIEYKHLFSKIEKEFPKIMLFLNNKEIRIYKSEKNTSKVPENENLFFLLIESIKIEEIITIITRKQTKNIVTIQFTSELHGNTSIIIDLITDIDSKSFISKTKSIIEENKLSI